MHINKYFFPFPSLFYFLPVFPLEYSLRIKKIKPNSIDWKRITTYKITRKIHVFAQGYLK